MAVKMELARVMIRETDDWHVVELREIDGRQRTFQIVIGLTEAAAIERRILGQSPPRPQTHELLANVIAQLGYRIDRVVVSDLRHDELGRGTFFARLILLGHSGSVDIDCRPSDAIALGVATDVPIYVEEHVLDAASQSE
jgi:bifunctional DNase/RNase